MSRAVLLLAIALLGLAGAGTGIAVKQHHSSAAPGQSSTAAGRLTLRQLWSRSIQPNADSSPAYLAHVSLPDGKQRAMIFVLAANNTSNCSPGNPVHSAVLYALDAKSGAIRWTRSTSGQSRCSTSSPVGAGQWVYAAGLDGKIHRYNAGNGAEYTRQHWPELVSRMPDVEKISAAPTITGRHLYATTSGFIGDAGHYQGHVVTIDLRTGGAQVFNALCSNIHQILGPSSSRPNYCSAERAAFFGRGEGVTDPITHDVYVVSGNGNWNGKTNWGDSVLKLDPGGSRLLDAFTPTNQADLDAQDLDLGSTGPALLPPITVAGKTYHLLVQAGKGPACGSCGGVALRLLNRDNLSGQGGPGHLGGDLDDTQTPGECEVLTGPAVSASTGLVFYANDCGTAAYKVTAAANGKLRLTRVWFSPQGGSTPVLSGGVLYVASPGQLTAYQATSGHVLWKGSIGGIHWEYPLVAGHRLYLTDQNGHVSAWSISGGS
jgi:outer membrane protein assembly factor BamB